MTRDLRPLFRWPGGKRWLLPELLRLVPATYGRYYEPFVGGGALFFALRPKRAVLGDKNQDLINAYTAIKTDPEELGRRLRAMARTRENYYAVRASTPEDSIGRAARTIFLVTLSFNGIYRVNKAGIFNVPFGDREYASLGSADSLAECSLALQSAVLIAGDFSATLTGAKRGDLIYLDPPYTVAHSNNGFVKYNAKIFMPEHQTDLAKAAHALADRGCHVIVSNAHHESVRTLYTGFECIEVERRSVIAASSAYRQPVKEYVFARIHTAATASREE